ncbi:MAG: glutamate-ammonia-ligase adenylyltransferase [Gemmatales bacterium]|nr:MAG: glutamate-ammonia-ligase adenylyltransferase [Gemmatales bacterium]
MESIEHAKPMLSRWNLRDSARGMHNIDRLKKLVSADEWEVLSASLDRLLPKTADADMALNNLERFLDRSEGVAQIPVLLEDHASILDTMLQLFSTSQYFSDLLVANPEYLDMLRVPLRKSPSKSELQEALQKKVDAAFEDSAVLKAFRRYRQRQLLRIGTNDIIRNRPLDEITADIARVADAALEVALNKAIQNVARRFGEPFTHAGKPARCVIIAFGKLGGEELNYSSDIDLMFLYDEEGETRGKRVSCIDNSEFFGRVVSEVVRLLSSHTEQGWAYRIDLRLRPEGQRGPLARSLASTLSYYDTLGRTWERQALIKIRPVAGDLELGQEFLRNIEPFVYTRYLSFAEINGIKALKRRIEHKTQQAGTSEREVKTGLGGIRDVEFVIQFLQLLNGGDLPEIRERNTLKAMKALERAGCLTSQEYHILDDTYRFLRNIEHRLQILFDLQTHQLPIGDNELRKLALRMGYSAADSDPAQAFLADYRAKTGLNRHILNHLLHQTFADEASEPESDLILDPHPDEATIRNVLGRYPFRDIGAAYNNLVQLARETVPFLPAQRCRHFLASIARKLLEALAETPDPDMALMNLEKVTASLGAKGILWELFSFNPPVLKLFVDLCAWSQFLCDILINNPGMIDELLDSLVLNQPRTAEELRTELAELCRHADDPEPILHSFQDKELLRIGVRDILGKDTIRETMLALSDLAETILVRIAEIQEPKVQKRFGVPYLETSEGQEPRIAKYALLGMGKLGGRELSYHSDLDLILVYEGDGRTGRAPGASRFTEFEETDNFHYFTELARRIIKMASFHGPMGRLYEVDMRLRPTGKSGSLVIPLVEFERYYAVDGGAQLWERQALTRARLVHGDPEFGERVMEVVRNGAFGCPWNDQCAKTIAEMRQRLEASRSSRDLKRGFGCIVDVEFAVQIFQLKYGRQYPSLQTPDIWAALDAIRDAKLLSPEECDILRNGYHFLRLVQLRLRIVQNRSQDELPESTDEVEKLARLLGFEPASGQTAAERFFAELEHHTTQIRNLFLTLVERER